MISLQSSSLGLRTTCGCCTEVFNGLQSKIAPVSKLRYQLFRGDDQRVGQQLEKRVHLLSSLCIRKSSMVFSRRLSESANSDTCSCVVMRGPVGYYPKMLKGVLFLDIRSWALVFGRSVLGVMLNSSLPLVWSTKVITASRYQLTRCSPNLGRPDWHLALFYI